VTLQAHFDTHQVSHVSEEFKRMVQGDFTRPLKRPD
jgi:hypothetical protein